MSSAQTGLVDILGMVAGNPALLRFLQETMHRPKSVDLFCTTLRDGGQTRAVTWTAADKISIARKAIEAGIRHIEVGWPVPGDKVNPEVFRQLARLLRQKEYRDLGVILYAFMGTVKTRKAGQNITAKNPMVKCVLDTGVKNVVVFGKSWKLHVRDVLGITLKENIRIIEETVRVLVESKREVTYDAEHAVDGWRDDPKYFFRTLEAAIKGGATRVVLCDTRGGTLPAEWLKFLLEVVPWLKERGVEWGVHTHNDSGTSDANSLLAVELGCDHVQGTIGGIGERTGNANLTTIIVALREKMGIRVVTRDELRLWTALTRYVYSLSGIQIPFSLPYAGAHACHHEGGTHVDAWMKNPDAVEHIRAELVGNRTTLGTSNQAGKALMRRRIAEVIPRLRKGDPRIGELLEAVHGLESEGWLFETADASFRLLALHQLGKLEPFFSVFSTDLNERIPEFTGLPGEDLDRALQKQMGGSPQATVHVRLPSGIEIGPKAGNGDGLVDAFDNAMRKALQERGGSKRPAVYPELERLELINYHVKALIKHDGTAAKVRVVLFFRTEGNGDEIWGTVAVSESVTEASVRALAAGYQYFLHEHRNRSKVADAA